ncbi:hypothetical protein C8F04DRAFT_1192045 [Mycena alexandri]|uniref:Uncharacterized protein n=1 Tax=Mycena alexandri TaxID=1745969 RepID=A0AAD6WTL5_9AGAR|nr:hypothetical protein C8F04DRAFT_1192045 [Mycena alexandri]
MTNKRAVNCTASLSLRKTPPMKPYRIPAGREAANTYPPTRHIPQYRASNVLGVGAAPATPNAPHNPPTLRRTVPGKRDGRKGGADHACLGTRTPCSLFRPRQLARRKPHKCCGAAKLIPFWKRDREATPRAHELPSIRCLHSLHSLLPFLSGAKSASETPPHTPPTPIERPKKPPAERKPPHSIQERKRKNPPRHWIYGKTPSHPHHRAQKQARVALGTRTAAGGR